MQLSKVGVDTLVSLDSVIAGEIMNRSLILHRVAGLWVFFWKSI